MRDYKLTLYNLFPYESLCCDGEYCKADCDGKTRETILTFIGELLAEKDRELAAHVEGMETDVRGLFHDMELKPTEEMAFAVMYKDGYNTALRDLLAHLRQSDAPQGCCEWTGKKNAKGYGIVLINGKQMFVHRLAVALSGRDIPKDKVCDHLCRNHSCYNPEHIELVTIAENVKRGESPAAIAANRTACAKGHEYTEENTRLQKDKIGRISRHCRICYAARKRELNRHKKAPQGDSVEGV